MNISKKKNSSQKKKIFILVAIIIFVAIATLAILEKAHVTDFVKLPAQQNPQGPTKEQIEEQEKIDEDRKQDFIESPETPSTPTQPGSVELTAKQESDGTVTILTKLHDVASGTCDLVITNGSKTFTQSAQVIYQPSFSSCAGFSVNKEKLGAGQWSIKVSVSGNGSQLEQNTSLGVN